MNHTQQMCTACGEPLDDCSCPNLSNAESARIAAVVRTTDCEPSPLDETPEATEEFLKELEELGSDTDSRPPMQLPSDGEILEDEDSELFGEDDDSESSTDDGFTSELTSDGVEFQLEEPLYPGFVLDQRDMERLARSHLDDAVKLFEFSFFTGHCEEDKACYHMARFERVAEQLGEECRRAVIDALDEYRARGRDDQWQFFKYTCTPGFWSTPADFDAVARFVWSIPDDMPPEVEDRFGWKCLDIVREVKEKIRESRLAEIGDWQKEGF